MKILILSEQHIDSAVSDAEHFLIAHCQKKYGFDALCLEYTAEKAEDLINNLNSTITTIQQSFLIPSLNQLKKHFADITENELLKMDMVQLSHLLMMYVSSKKYVEGASALLSFKPTKRKLEIVKQFNTSMLIRGFDKEIEQPQKPENFAIREKHMADNLEELFNSGKKTIAIVGHSHVGGLREILREKNLLQHTKFVSMFCQKIPEEVVSKSLIELIKNRLVSTLHVDPKNLLHAIKEFEYIKISDLLDSGCFAKPGSQVGNLLYYRQTKANNIPYFVAKEKLKLSY